MTSPGGEVTISRDELRKQIEAIRSNKSDIGDLPEKVQNWHGDLVKLIRANGYAGALTGNFVGAFSTEQMVDHVWGNRDKINDALGDTWDKLVEIDPGLEVPIKFIDYADEWRNITGDIIHAYNSFRETNLIAEWQGDAANRYREMRDRQEEPLKSLPQTCGSIANSLEEVARKELELYTDLATKSQDLVEKVTTFAANYVGSFFDLPLGPLSASDNLVAAVQASKSFILGAVTSIATNAQANMIEGNKIAQELSVQGGLPDNKWPPAVVAAYGNGIGGIRNAIGDASVTDGDKSDWNIRTTEVPL